MPSRFHHVAIVVSDVSRARDFYLRVFQLPETARPGGGQGAWFRVGEGELHLQYRAESPAKSDQHFALTVDDLDEVLARARKENVRVNEASPLEGTLKRAFVFDPDGNRIEVLQLI